MSGNAEQMRVIPERKLDSVRSLKAFEYANDPAYWKKADPEKEPAKNDWMNALRKSGAVKIIFYLIIAGFLLLIIYRILKEQNLLIFTRKSLNRKIANRSVDLAEKPDLVRLLSEAERAGNYRESVRIEFLQTLYLLGEKGLVEYHPEWPNSRYLHSLQQSSLYPGFKRLTGIYEFVYYGGFETDAGKYMLIKKEFTKFRKELP